MRPSLHVFAWLAASLAIAAPAGATDAADPGVKTLEAVNIEGELRLPQVLFITSRDSRRPLDYLEVYAAIGAAELGADTPMPGNFRFLIPLFGISLRGPGVVAPPPGSRGATGVAGVPGVPGVPGSPDIAPISIPAAHEDALIPSKEDQP